MDWLIDDAELAADTHEMLDELTRGLRHDCARMNALVRRLPSTEEWIARWKASGAQFDARHDGVHIVLRSIEGGRDVQFPIDPEALCGVTMAYQELVPILFNKVIMAWMARNV